jgi:transposase-like protein
MVFEWFGVDRSHGAVWNLTYKLLEEQVGVDGEDKWLYAAIDTDSKLLLEVDVFSRRGVGPAAAFLHRLTEDHEVSDTDFFVDGGGYLTALTR